MKDLQSVLFQRLRNKGLESDLIPGFMKIMAQAMVDLSDAGPEEVNKRLHFLGWDDFDLDDHTLQLIIANLEANESAVEGVSHGV